MQFNAKYNSVYSLNFPKNYREHNVRNFILISMFQERNWWVYQLIHHEIENLANLLSYSLYFTVHDRHIMRSTAITFKNISFSS